MHPAEAVEFSRPVAVDRIGATLSQYEIEANATERAALAERFALLGLERFTAKIILRRLRKDLIRVRGRLTASLTQACVVTLEPVAAEIAEDFELDFIEGAGDRGRNPEGDSDAELDLDAEAADGPELLLGPEIDLGEVAAEQLGLAIDPYPRKPGAAIPAEWIGEETPAPTPAEKVNPFASLEKLRKGEGEA